MRKILILFCTLVMIFTNSTTVFPKTKNTKFLNNYNKTINKNLATDLAFSEMQIFHKIYSQEALEERISRLEIEIYGAIQDGNNENRIKALKKAVTNISSGGNGLQYNTSSLFGLNTRTFTNDSWNINNNYYKSFSPHNVIHHKNFHTRHIPPKPHHSHRIDYPDCNTIRPNGNYSQNYSLGTSIKILDD